MCSDQTSARINLPRADFAFDRDGVIYYSAAAPGFTSEILRIDHNGSMRSVTRDVGAPAGIDVAPDGRIYYADYERNAVMELLPAGRSRTVADNVRSPVGLAVDGDGRIWVGAAAPNAEPGVLGDVPATRILRFTPGETPERVLSTENTGFTFFDVDGAGNLYLPAGRRLLLRRPSGEVDEIAAGFGALRGAAVSQDGSIWLTDYGRSALYRLVPESDLSMSNGHIVGQSFLHESPP